MCQYNKMFSHVYVERRGRASTYKADFRKAE